MKRTKGKALGNVRRTNRATRAARRSKALDQACRRIAGLRPEALRVLSPLIGELSAATLTVESDKALRAWARRTFCVLRYRQVRRMEKYRTARLTDIVAKINTEAARVDPAWRCSARSLQEWQHTWNAVGSDGFAVCWRGLLHPWRSVPHARPGGSGRRIERSPEAVAFFHRLYVDGNAQKIAPCHRSTLREARRRGWRWPKTAASTYTWLRTCKRRAEHGSASA